jgi:nucleoside-diphosphate-sugar epimerase
MKLAVTGATGFTGRHFERFAQKEGYEVWPLTCDITDVDAVVHQVHQISPHAVVHLAGKSFVGHEDQAEVYRVNTVGTTHLLDALCQLPKRPNAVLIASSATVYGNSDVTPILETQSLAPVNHYGASKLAMECLVRIYQDRLPIIVARPFNYTGVGQSDRFLVPKLVKHFATRQACVALGNTHIRREFNDVRMVCQVYLKLLSVGQTGQVYNVCTGKAYSINELLSALGELTGHCPEVKLDPALVRDSELHELYGDPARLRSLVDLPSYSLSDTLGWMLEAASSR